MPKIKQIYLPATMDLFHIGHLQAIRQCAKKGEVTVGLLTDVLIKKYKGKAPIINFEQRRRIIMALPEVKRVVAQGTLAPYLKKYDWLASGDGFEEEESRAAEKYGCELFQFKYTPRQSTTKIKDKILKIYGK